MRRDREWKGILQMISDVPALARKVEASALDMANPTLESLNHLIDEVIGSELASHGFDPAFVPTEYGLRLEAILDRANRFRLRGEL